MTIPNAPPTSKAEKFRARANACVEQAENCSTEARKNSVAALAPERSKMAYRRASTPLRREQFPQIKPPGTSTG